MKKVLGFLVKFVVLGLALVGFLTVLHNVPITHKMEIEDIRVIPAGSREINYEGKIVTWENIETENIEVEHIEVEHIIH